MPTKLQRYDKYKPSGLDWLGDIPEGWKNYRINWICKIIRGNSSFKKDELLDSGEYVALQYGKTYKVDEVNKTFNFYVNSEFFKRDQVVNNGNIILVSTSETIEDLGHTCFYNRKDLGLIGGEQILLKPKNIFIFEKYLYYYSKLFSKELTKHSKGLKVYRFNIDDLKKLYIPIPNKHTQTTIAKYLDTHTANIDQEIDLLTQKASKYLQLKQTLISDTVTGKVIPACNPRDKSRPLNKGYISDSDKKIPLGEGSSGSLGVMKPSGVEWIGDIPEGWEVRRLKEVSNLQTGNSIANKDLYLDKSNSIPYIATKDINIETQEIAYQNDIYIPINDLSFRVAKKNTILLCIEGGSAGRKIAITDQEVCYVNKLVGISSKTNKLFHRYNYFFVQSNIFKYQFFYYINGLIGGVSVNTLKNQLILVPPFQNQIQIAKYLDEQTGKIDQIITTINSKITKLREFRKVLINDVVTGRVKIEN